MENRKQLWETRLNGSSILVKATQETMEKLFQKDITSDYVLAKIYNGDKLMEVYQKRI